MWQTSAWSFAFSHSLLFFFFFFLLLCSTFVLFILAFDGSWTLEKIIALPNQYKISALCYKCTTRTAPSYLRDCLCDCLQLYKPSCTLCSASDTLCLQIPYTTYRLSTVGSCAFSVFGPSTWNDLPLPLQQKPSLDSFKPNLKTFLFQKQQTCHAFSSMPLSFSTSSLCCLLKLCVN